jgi:hypothetical protein
MNRLIPRIFVALSMLTFAVSLTQRGYCANDGFQQPGAWGFALFLVGWLGLFDGVIAWFGNPLLLAAWIYFFIRERRASEWLAIGALAVMLSFLLVGRIATNENGQESTITSHGLAYWLWVLSAVLQVVASADGLMKKKKLNETPEPAVRG